LHPHFDDVGGICRRRAPLAYAQKKKYRGYHQQKNNNHIPDFSPIHHVTSSIKVNKKLPWLHFSSIHHVTSLV
jgi:hypothetical protein